MKVLSTPLRAALAVAALFALPLGPAVAGDPASLHGASTQQLLKEATEEKDLAKAMTALWGLPEGPERRAQLNTYFAPNVRYVDSYRGELAGREALSDFLDVFQQRVPGVRMDLAKKPLLLGDQLYLDVDFVEVDGRRLSSGSYVLSLDDQGRIVRVAAEFE